MNRLFSINKHWQAALLISSILLSVIFSASVWFTNSLNQKLNLVEPLLFEIKKGSNLNQVCTQLKNKAAVSDCLALKINARLNSKISKIKSGTYQLLPDQQLDEVVMIFNKGEVVQLPFVIVEGENIFQVIEKIKANVHLVDDLSGKSLVEVAELLELEQSHPEGFLYPETYFYSIGSKASELLKRAVVKQTRLLDDLWQKRSPTTLLKTPYEALILASIIEKESSHDIERDLVASVFYNRITKGMRLQTDPTVIYGVWEEYKGDITKRHLREKTPYNTYRINGLPPTPIANPSLSSLQAVFSPAESDYLYFVADGEGQHVFSKTLKSHNQALRAYLRKLKENG